MSGVNFTRIHHETSKKELLLVKKKQFNSIQDLLFVLCRYIRLHVVSSMILLTFYLV